MQILRLLVFLCYFWLSCAAPKELIIDTDVDTEDILAILYALKFDSSKVNIKAITLNTNAWTNAGSAVNMVYDVLHMMGRDDIPVGVGGEGGISSNGTIFPNVGGYLPIIDQTTSTWGSCRYKEAIPPGTGGGMVDIDTNYGLRKQFLPQARRQYDPFKQGTTQEVLLKALSSGSNTVLLLGAQTNFALLLMSHPEVKKHVEHIYIMGGGVNSSNPNGCPCGQSCTTSTCGNRGNLFTAVQSNPWAEFNLFGDPFAAYKVLHSGIPITLIPLDATNTVPASESFLTSLNTSGSTIEAMYSFLTLKMVHDTWFDDHFYTSFFMWDSFATSVALSGLLNGHDIEKNEFAVISYKNVTVVTSNKPYGINDGSNPFYLNRNRPLFNLAENGVHSGHVQTGLHDPFCLVANGKGKCMDGYTMETQGEDAVTIRVAENSKPTDSTDKTFYASFAHMLRSPKQTAKFNFETQFPYYKEVQYRRNSTRHVQGKPVVFDMDMSPADIIALFYLLKTSVETIDLKAITVGGNGWANGAAIDIVYDVLHMMGRDDIPVGLGDFFALNQSYAPSHTTGECKYRQAVPHGSGGLIDSDTLYGLARKLPRSPRRYTAENSVAFGAPRDTDHPELRQPTAVETFQNILKSLNKKDKITLLATGPLTNVARFLNSSNIKKRIEHIYVAGGSINPKPEKRRPGIGNVFSIPQNQHAEINMFLDPKAANFVLNSEINVTLIPLDVTEKLSQHTLLEKLSVNNCTAESLFVQKILSRFDKLQLRKKTHSKHMLGDLLAAAILVDDKSIEAKFDEQKISVEATGDISRDGWMRIDAINGSRVRTAQHVNSSDFDARVSAALNSRSQSAVVSSFHAQTLQWRKPPTT